MEVDLPIDQTWEIATDVNNWLLMDDKIESFHCEKEIKTGSVITAKLKNTDLYMPFLITSLEPLKNIDTVCTGQFFKQYSFESFEEIAPNRTKITLEVVLESGVVPFVKSRLKKEMDCSFSKFKSFFNECANERNVVYSPMN